jgi:peptidoglycan/xylan/chitin deacetylase (PgdA/CDA1 family)
MTLSVRESLRQSVIALATRTGQARRAGVPVRRVVVLCYHSVHPSKSFASATPSIFGRHLDWLTEHCDVVPLEEIAQAVSAATRMRPAVAITFDDGYADNFEFAFPILHSRRVPATFFVTAGLMENDARVMARQQVLRRARYDDVRPMDWDQVRALRAAGMEIGAHTYSHPNLAVLSRSRASEELRRSKQVIEDRVGETIRSMAYPFGKPGRHFSRETMALTEEAGYAYACAVLFRAVRASDSRFAIPRFFVTQDGVRRLKEKVLGAWDVIGTWQEKCPLWLARAVSPKDFTE